MEFHQLRYFVAVARLRSFTRAAESEHVAQPSLSQQIRKLEDELGARLFNRLGRSVTLTPFGACFELRARRVRAKLSRDRGQPARGTHRVAACATRRGRSGSGAGAPSPSAVRVRLRASARGADAPGCSPSSSPAPPARAAGGPGGAGRRELSAVKGRPLLSGRRA